MEDVTDTDYMYPKRVCKDFEIKHLGEYHDLYLKIYYLFIIYLLLAVFENFRKTCLKIYHLDPVKFLSVSELGWQAALKKTKVKLTPMKDYDKNKKLPYLKYWDVNNLFGWAISHKLPVNKFEWIGDTSQFNEDFIKNYNEESDEGYFLEVDIQYPEKLHEQESKNLLLIYMIKLNMLFTYKVVNQALNHNNFEKSL